MLITAIIFIAILLLLVISHEAGHFFAARKSGVAVEEFGFGIPPRIGGIKRGGTLYSFNLLPFGGFVKLYGEEGEDETNPQSFGGKPWYKKTAILLAGVAANMLVAYIALSIASFSGIPAVVPDNSVGDAARDAQITIIEVLPDSPATKASILPGDIIISAADTIPKNTEETQRLIALHAGTEISVVIEREGKEITLAVTPRRTPPDGEGPLGIALSLVQIERAAWYQAPITGARLTYNITANILSGFASVIKTLIAGEGSSIQVAGPVGIFSLTGQAKSSGASALLLFIAILSINLAIINTLPIPGLDGGRLLFVLLETVRGQKISSHASSLIHGIGLAVLLCLMLIITYKDIARLF